MPFFGGPLTLVGAQNIALYESVTPIVKSATTPYEAQQGLSKAESALYESNPFDVIGPPTTFYDCSNKPPANSFSDEAVSPEVFVCE